MAILEIQGLHKATLERNITYTVVLKKPLFVKESTDIDGKVIVQERTADKSSTIKTKQQLCGRENGFHMHIIGYGKISIKVESIYQQISCAVKYIMNNCEHEDEVWRVSQYVGNISSNIEKL